MRKLIKKITTFGILFSVMAGNFTYNGITSYAKENDAYEVSEETKDIEAFYHQPEYTWIDESWDEEVQTVESEYHPLYECNTCGLLGDYDEIQDHKDRYKEGTRNNWIYKHEVRPFRLYYRHEDNNGNVWWVEEKDEEEEYICTHPAWFLCDDGNYYKVCGGWKGPIPYYIPKTVTKIIHHEDGHYELTKKGYYDVVFADDRNGWNVNVGKDSTQISTQIVMGNKLADTETEHEYRWSYRKVAEKTGDAVGDEWKEISGWHTTDKFTDTIDFIPDAGRYEMRSGYYEVKVQVAVKGMPETMKEKVYRIKYGDIVGKCQMPNPNGSGYLIGVESYTNDNYSYEMLILDCTLLAQGKDAWTYTTGKCGSDTNCLWTVWDPQYGYYWTLFRVFDSEGNMLDQECFGFVNAY